MLAGRTKTESCAPRLMKHWRPLTTWNKHEAWWSMVLLMVVLSVISFEELVVFCVGIWIIDLKFRFNCLAFIWIFFLLSMSGICITRLQCLFTSLCSHFIHSLFSCSSFPEPSYPTINVLSRFVGIVLYNHLDEVHALNSEAFKGHPLPCRCEHVADGKFQGTLDKGYKCTWMVLQEI